MGGKSQSVHRRLILVLSLFALASPSSRRRTPTSSAHAMRPALVAPAGAMMMMRTAPRTRAVAPFVRVGSSPVGTPATRDSRRLSRSYATLPSPSGGGGPLPPDRKGRDEFLRASLRRNDGADSLSSSSLSGSFAVDRVGENSSPSLKLGLQRRGVANVSNAAASASSVNGNDHDGVQEERLVIDNENENKNGSVSMDDEVDSAGRASSMISSVSDYEKVVMKLFPDTDDKAFGFNGHACDRSKPSNSKEGKEDDYFIDPYWMEPLLSLTRPSSRSLVEQLQSAGCPMGYNPSAGPAMSARRQADLTSASAPRKTTSLLSFVRSRKSGVHPNSVLLVRVGDFYESYGVDAILLVEHCGLNPMAGKARAGCPWRNVQATLDCLTGVGFRVAVYEEQNGEERAGAVPGDDNSEEGGRRSSGSGSKLKARYLQQVVSSANPTYMHGLVLSDEAGDLPASSPGRSHVGVIEDSGGYTLVEVSAEERTVVVSERLTAEAVSCRLAAYPPADPLFYAPRRLGDGPGKRRRAASDRLPFLPWSRRAKSPQLALWGCSRGDVDSFAGSRLRVRTLPPSLIVEPTAGLSDIERAKQTVVSAVLQLEGNSIAPRSSSDDDGLSSLRKRGRSRVATNGDFVIVSSPGYCPGNTQQLSSCSPAATKMNPLHLETASQLGLLSDPAMPPLISSLLPSEAPSSSRRFLRRWLLVPPPPEIADSMSRLVKTLKDDSDRALPSPNGPPLAGKVISLIREGQASAPVYREILSALNAAGKVLLLDNEQEAQSGIVDPLMEILRHDTGLSEASDSGSLRLLFGNVANIIEGVVSTPHEDHPDGSDSISYHGDVVPPAFFDRNEATWRGRVKPAVLDCAREVSSAARRLAEATAIDFWGVNAPQCDRDGVMDLSGARETKNPVIQDIFNNLLALKSIPSWANEETEDEKDSDNSKECAGPRYFHPRDRNGKILLTRYTTERVQEAMCSYVEACADARSEVERMLRMLAWDLVDDGHLPAILQASHLNLVLSTVSLHAGCCRARGWNVASVRDDDCGGPPSAGHFNGLWPHWMDKSDSVPNSFDLDGLFLLTAPNMSGKSTLMRSTAAAALLINCGLCAPVGPGSWARRFDAIFVRGASPGQLANC